MMCLLIFLVVGWVGDGGWVAQESGTMSRLRGICAVSARVAWASGADGTVLRTVEGGEHWARRVVPSAESLDFRDVEAFDEATACVLSIGLGSASRIYKTKDGGASWRLVYQVDDPRGFLDAIAFWDAQRGIAVGDPVDGKFMVLLTEDGGETWRVPVGISIPDARDGEGAFAASGTCLVTFGEQQAWFATGGSGVSRVFRTGDGGRTWRVAETPIPAANASSGVFSLAYRDEKNGFAVGGDYQRPEVLDRIVATTEDAGESWKAHAGGGPRGYRSCVAWLPVSKAYVAVGPSGTDLLRDGSSSWEPLSERGFHACAFANDQDVGWAVGEAGAIARINGPFTRR